MWKMYPDEAVRYSKIINKRKKSEYLAQLAIVHNPHSKNPEKLVESLQRESDTGYNDIVPDKDSISRLKSKLKAKSKSIRIN